MTKLTTGRNRRDFRAVVASDWTRWPELLESGLTPLMATTMVLVGGAASIPPGLPLDANGEVVIDVAG